MRFFNRRHTFKFLRQLDKSFLTRHFRKPLIHIRPLIVLTVCRRLEIYFGIFYRTAMEFFIPHLRVFFFVQCSFRKNRRNLLKPIFLRL